MVDVTTAIQRHREKVLKAHRVRNPAQLVALVDAFGFVFAFTLRAGDAPIPACFDHLSTNNTDRKWGWMWPWKDELPEAKKLYYGVLVARTLELAGAVTEKQLLRLFDWDDTIASRAIERAERDRKLVRVDGSLVLPELAH